MHTADINMRRVFHTVGMWVWCPLWFSVQLCWQENLSCTDIGGMMSEDVHLPPTSVLLLSLHVYQPSHPTCIHGLACGCTTIMQQCMCAQHSQHHHNMTMRRGLIGGVVAFRHHVEWDVNAHFTTSHDQHTLVHAVVDLLQVLVAHSAGAPDRVG